MNVIVTVGICVKNGEKTIGAALESVLNQDYPHKSMEIIVINDGSNDNTFSVVSEILSASDFSHKILQGNGSGLGVVRQMVVDNAGGKYVVWVDDGLILSKNHVQKQVEFVEKHPEVGQARAKWGWYEKEGLLNSLENLMLLSYESKVDSKANSSKLRGIGGSICRLEALRKVGGFDSRIKRAGEDIELSARLKAAGWKLTVSDAKFYYAFVDTWKKLWHQNFSYGYGAHFVRHQHDDSVSLFSMLPCVGFIVGLVNSIKVYRLTIRKVSFLLPLHFVFKRTAWFFGFIKSHKNAYGHFH